MKLTPIIIVSLILLTEWTVVRAQDMAPEVPGDHFSLEGALELFKRSESPEEFERLLNEPDSRVNNLDLDGDGYIDYIRVLDRNRGNVHAFILQAVISEGDYQDVAVIELEKLSNGKAVLQIIGDEDVYGVETIIEPTREVRTYAGATTARNVVNVWAWPSVRYVYGPHYTVWISPWRWHVRPVWWQPWRPVTYVYYYDYWRPYRPYYSVCHTYRVAYARELYRPYRTTSVVVRDRHHTQLTRYRSSYHDGDRRGYHRDDTRRTYTDRGSRNDGGRQRTALLRDDATGSAPESGRDRSEVLRREGAAGRESTQMNTRLRTRAPGTHRYGTAPQASDDFSSTDRRREEYRPADRGRSLRSDSPVQRPATVQRGHHGDVQRGVNGGRRDYTEERSSTAERPSMRTPQRQPQSRRESGLSRQPQVTRQPEVRRQTTPGMSRGRTSQAPNYQRQSSRTDELRGGGRGRD